MAKLTINGQKVTVDDSFFQLSPEDQDATVDEIAASLGGGEQQAPVAESPQEPSYGRQIFSGLLEGATGALGAPVDLMNNLVVKPATVGINAVFGTDIQPSSQPLGGSDGLRQGLAIDEQSGDTGQQMARRVAQSVGGAAVPAFGSANTTKQIAAMLMTGAGGGVGGAVAQQAFPDNVGAEIAGELLGGIGTGGAIAGIASRQARTAAEATVPSVDDLKAKSGALYDKAEARNLQYQPAETQKLASDIRDMAVDQGLDPTLHPKAVASLGRLDEYATQPMSVKNARTVQRILSGAAKDPTNPDQSRIAAMIKGEFDNFISKDVPEISEANKLYSRAKKAETVAKALNKAELRTAARGTGGNIDNAMRQKMVELLTNDKDIRAFSSAEKGLMTSVVKGSKLQDGLRIAGKLSPTSGGLMSVIMGGGAVTAPHIAIPAAIGGFAAKTAADSMTYNNAKLLDVFIRSGGQMPTGSTGGLKRKLIEALLGSQAATQSYLNRD